MDPYDVPTAPDALRTELMARERLLHFPEPGTSREQFESGVVAGYWEAGASGGSFDVDVIWDVVRRRAAGDPSAYGDLGTDPPWATAEEELRELGPGVYLLTYLLIQGERRTRRATIWRRGETAGNPDSSALPSEAVGGAWVSAYHQGTVVTGRW